MILSLQKSFYKNMKIQISDVFTKIGGFKQACWEVCDKQRDKKAKKNVILSNQNTTLWTCGNRNVSS